MDTFSLAVFVVPSIYPNEFYKYFTLNWLLDMFSGVKKKNDFVPLQSVQWNALMSLSVDIQVIVLSHEWFSWISYR